MRPWFDRTIWIVLAAVIAGASAVYGLTGSTEATAACALSGLFALALLYDATERHNLLPSLSPDSVTEAGASANGGDELETLLRAVPTPLLIIHRGRIEHCNEPAMLLLGEHIRGEDVRLAIRHPAAIDLVNNASPEIGPAHVDIVGLGAPEQVWEFNMQPLSSNRQLVLLIDQSGRQATERMRVDFVANASHELRTPLAGILGFIETLRDPLAGADAATRDRFLTIMDGEARRMQRLVDDLMSLSRIEAEKYQAPNQPVSLAQLADEVANVFRQTQNKRAQDVVVAISPDLPMVRGDRIQLSQLLHNLISNALKYGAPDTEVRVLARHLPHDMIEISVVDRGDGIAPEHLPRLTERFYRVDSGRSRAMGGTGLGLAIVKHIVQRHRGLLHVESTVGQGTTIRVELPVFGDLGRRMDGPPLPISSRSAPIQSDRHKTAT
jgi:two-component system phosphate regulon sensor histidine kinase PhoR